MYFKYLRDELSHFRYVVHPPPPPYLGTLLLSRNTERAAATSGVRDPAPKPVNGGKNGGSSLRAGRGGDDGGTPGQRRILSDGAPNTNPRQIHRLLLLLGEKTNVMCWNIALPIPGDVAFFKC